MSLILPMRRGQAPVGVANPYVAQAVRFDGSNDYALRGAGLTGAADSKLVTGSVWINKQGSDGGTEYVVNAARFAIWKDNNNKFALLGRDSSNTLNLVARSSTNTVEVADGWVHCLFSFDLSDTGKRHLYINDGADLDTITPYTDSAIDLTQSEWGLGAAADTSLKANAEFADIALWFGVYVDFSVSANRRLFIDAAGKPVDLGDDGTTPGIGTPIAYFSKRGADDADDFVTNKGSGGGFTLTGALADAASSPSD